MLADVLQVKRLREQDAAAVVQTAREKLEAARAALREAEAALVRQHEFRLAEEQRQFDEIKGEAVPVARIDEMKLAISIMRETEMEMERDVETAREAVPPFEEALRAAEVAHREAMAVVLKFEELVAEEVEEADRAAAYREEAEAEEVTEVLFGGHRRRGT